MYPIKSDEREKLENAIIKQFENKNLKNELNLVLVIREIEAWFLADKNLFERINGIATEKKITELIGNSEWWKNPELVEHPAGIVNKIYKLFGSKYKKREYQSYKIAHEVDFETMIEDEIIERVQSWKSFVKIIDRILEWYFKQDKQMIFYHGS